MGRIRFLNYSIPNNNEMHTRKSHKLNISVKSKLLLIPMLNYGKAFNCSKKTFYLLIIKFFSDLIDPLFQWLWYIDILVIILSLDIILRYSFLFPLFSFTNKQSTIGFSVYCCHDMPLIYNLLNKTLMPKPENCPIFLPKLVRGEGGWSLAQLPRGAVGSPSLEMLTSCLSVVLESLLQALLLEQGWTMCSPGFLATSATRIQPFCDSVVIRNSLTPHPSLTGLHMQPPDITLRHQEVSKNAQNKMEDVKGYKGMGKMIENSFWKAM